MSGPPSCLARQTSPINLKEASVGLTIGPKEVHQDFLKLTSNASWDSEQGHEINREAP